MSDYTFSVVLDGQETAVRMGEVIVPSLQVTTTTIGTVQVAGGVPGPQGVPGISTAGLVDAHIADATPHPAYDDLQSLTLLFENGLV